MPKTIKSIPDKRGRTILQVKLSAFETFQCDGPDEVVTRLYGEFLDAVEAGAVTRQAAERPSPTVDPSRADSDHSIEACVDRMDSIVRDFQKDH